MKKLILILVTSLMLAACTNSGGGSGGEGSTPTNGPDSPNNPSGGCQPQVTASSTNLEIAKAFNEWRAQCNPTAEQLEAALRSL